MEHASAAAASESMAMQEKFKFVGGRLDGGELPVPRPTQVGMELHVQLAEPWEPREYYVLREDGRFHFEQSAGGSAAVRRLDQSAPDDLMHV
jgi:hypothetical protein